MQTSGLKNGQATRDGPPFAVVSNERSAPFLIRIAASLSQDVCFALRTYRRNPAFAATVMFTLIAGIGLNAALFAEFEARVFRTPPARDPARLVTMLVLEQGQPGEGYFSNGYFSYADYESLSRDVPVFGKLAAYSSTTAASRFGALRGTLVSASYFEVMGGRMSLGRPPSDEEIRLPGGSPVVVVTDQMWRRRLDAAPDVIGKTIRLAGVSFTIIGVAEPGFGGLSSYIPDFWAPLTMTSVLGIPRDEVDVVGRLPDGVPIDQARAAMVTHARHVFPGKVIAGLSLSTHEPLRQLTRRAISQYIPIAAACGIVLLIACSNVGNLLLARAKARRREIGLRVSLGATRGRVVQQLFTESAILAVAAGLVSLLFSQWAATLVYEAREPAWQRGSAGVADFSLDFTVFAYTMLLSLLASALFGLAPALEVTRGDLTSAIGGGRQGRRRLVSPGPRDGLVAVQLALSVVLLSTAALLLSPLVRLRTFNPGFSVKDVFSVSIVRGLQENEEQRAARARLQVLLAEQIRAVQGVKGVSLARRSPFDPVPRAIAVPEGGTQIRNPGYAYVTPEYFQTLQIPILRGRQFTEREIATEAPVVIVSEAAASSLWPAQDPIGKHIQLHEQPKPDAAVASWRGPAAGPVEVIGVAKNVATGFQLDFSVSDCLYLPTRIDHPTHGLLLVRTDGSSNALSAIRAAFSALDQDTVLYIRPLSDGIGGLSIIQHFVPRLAAGLGVLGLLLAAVGLYGSMSYLVAERTQEIGIRMALGARRWSVLWLVLRHGLQIVLRGLLVGVFLTFAVSQMLVSALHGLSSLDPIALALVPLLLTIVCLTAAFVPSWRATRLDPLVTIRHE